MDSERRAETLDALHGDDPIDPGIEPEVVRWLSAYALADDANRDATVADLLAEASRLLHSYRSGTRDARPQGVACEAQLRMLAEQMPAILWTTDAEIRLTSYAGGALASMGVEPLAGEARSLAASWARGTSRRGL